MKRPLQLTLSIWQGQTFDDSLALKNSDDTAVDLTGYSAEMQVRTDVASSGVIASWTSADGDLVMGGDEGTITFAIPATETYALPTANDVTLWVYDIRIFTDDGYAERVAEGALVVYPAVTRPTT